MYLYKPYYLNMISMFILLMKSIKNGNKTYTLQMGGGHFDYKNDRLRSSFRHCAKEHMYAHMHLMNVFVPHGRKLPCF